MACTLSVAAVPLIGWKQSLGALLAGLASLGVTVALVEEFLHRRQQTIEMTFDDRQKAPRRAGVARDLSHFPLRSFTQSHTAQTCWGP